MTSVSACHIILTPTQPVGSGRPQRGSNPGPPHQESRALPTELLRSPKSEKVKGEQDKQSENEKEKERQCVRWIEGMMRKDLER